MAKTDADSYFSSFDYTLQRELEEGKRALEAALCSSIAADFAEYKFLCGQILGIRNAIEVIIELRERSKAEE